MTGETGMSSCRRKEETDGADCSWSCRVFQKMKMEAATGNERRPAVDRRYGETCSWSVNDDRRRRRPGRLDTGTSWFIYDDAIPFNTQRWLSTDEMTKVRNRPMALYRPALSITHHFTTSDAELTS